MNIVLDELEQNQENERGLGFSIALVLLFLLNCYYAFEGIYFLVVIDDWDFLINSTQPLFIINSLIYLICFGGMWLMKKKIIYLFLINILITLWISYDLWLWPSALLSLIYIWISFKFYLKIR